jgi:hypothetical protein
MRRALAIAGIASLAYAALPASAFAVEQLPASVFYPHIGVSLIGLAVAVLLLLQALGVRKIAAGGVIAEKISYVILAVLCLAASALTEWAVIFTAGVTGAQAQLAREVLAILAMGLLAAYFYSVRAAMHAYLTGMKPEEPSVSASEGESGRG